MGAALKDLYFIKICSIESSLIMLCRASHSVHGGGTSWILRFFSKPSPTTKTDALPWVPRPHLKMKPLIWKTNHPLKDETLFHEMIPRKSTIINNLKSLLKKYVWRSSFLVNLEDCRLIAGNFTIRWTPSQVFFDKILSSAHAPPMFWLKFPHVCNTCGKPYYEHKGCSNQRCPDKDFYTKIFFISARCCLQYIYIYIYIYGISFRIDSLHRECSIEQK